MSKHKLLLADDSVTIQKVVNLTFADEGIEVITVGDGNSAMEKFVEATPDLVMVDVNMPGVDGYRICEIIKQDDETKHVPVILLVGSFEPFDEEEARRVGANDYLTKPFQSIRQLVNKVTVLLNKSNGNEVSSQPKVETPPAEMPVQKQAEEVSEPLGDPGMDDEMIQANQIGSLPVGDIQRFESGNDVEIVPPQNELKTPYSETANEPDIEREEDFGKTQPLSAEEFKAMTSIPIAETSESEHPPQNYSNERISAEERADSLEKQMVSEFETEAKKMSSDFESEAREADNIQRKSLLRNLFRGKKFSHLKKFPLKTRRRLKKLSKKKVLKSKKSKRLLDKNQPGKFSPTWKPIRFWKNFTMHRKILKLKKLSNKNIILNPNLRKFRNLQNLKLSVSRLVLHLYNRPTNKFLLQNRKP